MNQFTNIYTKAIYSCTIKSNPICATISAFNCDIIQKEIYYFLCHQGCQLGC